MLKINTLITISLFGLTACGGGSSSSVTFLDGIFKDSNVTGLSYSANAKSGITDAGKFKYKEGEEITFSLGGINFGTALAKPVMTPVDLVMGGTLSHIEVVNRVRLLMMLDEDNIPSNGIVISSKVQSKATEWGAVDFAAVDFLNEVNTIQLEATAEDGKAHLLPSAIDAIAHLKTTMLCSYAGAFVGDYSGSRVGNIAFMVDPVTGEVKGSSYDSASQVSFAVNNITTIDYENGLDFETGENSAKKFSGKLSSVDDMQGTWVNVSDTTSTGTFTGSRLGGDNTTVYRYTAAFTNGGKGLYVFNIASDNTVTGTSYNVSTQAQSELTGTATDTTLTVVAADGTTVDGVIDSSTLELTGVWQNLANLSNGGFSGGGCKLN